MRAGTNVPRLLSPAEEWLLWRQCASEATRDLELVNRGALAEALRRARAIAADFDIDFQKAARSGELAVTAEGLVDLADAPGVEVALLAAVERAVEERCRALGAAPVASFISGMDAAEAESPVVGAGFLILPPRLQPYVVPQREAAPAAVPDIVIAADELDELERIAHWCSIQIARKPDVRLLITLPGGPGVRERLAALIRQTIHPAPWLEGASPESSMDNLVAIEGGGPLAGVPAVAHALFTLSWLGGGAGDFEMMSGWLRAPYWSAPGPAARARLDVWLRERERMHFKVRDFLAALSMAPSALASPAREVSARITRAVIAMGQGAASPRDWSERFRATLAVFDWPGERARTSGEQQTVVRFHELLDEFGQLASVTRSISRDNAIQWFTELAARTAFRPADDDAVITISAVFAPPVVHYDGLWIAGLNAEVFPQPVQPDPFLPLHLQLAAGVPAASASGRLAEARALLASWRACASELVLSVPARAGDLELLPSPLLTEWLPQGRAAVHSLLKPQELIAPGSQIEAASDSLWLPLRIQREGLLESFDDAVGVHWPKDRLLPSGTRSLELQNQCPFRAYAELRLGSTPLDAPEPGVAADQRGQLLHLALQKLWTRLRDSRGLAALADVALEATIHRSVEEAANEILRGTSSHRTRPATSSDAQGDLFGNPQYSPSLSRECRRAERLIRALCAVERERAPFRVDGTELDSTLTLLGGAAQLRIRIDRVDALESGGRAILDYKSGRRAPADWYGDRPSHPQLLAYLAALGDDVIAMATVNITGREVRFDGIASRPELLPKVKGVEAAFGTAPEDAWPARRKEWLSRIEQLAAGFLAGRAVLDPKPGACDYCHVASVCRIADRGLVGESDGSA